MLPSSSPSSASIRLILFCLTKTNMQSENTASVERIIANSDHPMSHPIPAIALAGPFVVVPSGINSRMISVRRSVVTAIVNVGNTSLVVSFDAVGSDVAVLDDVGLDVAVLPGVGSDVAVLDAVGSDVAVVDAVGSDVAVLDAVGSDVAVLDAVGLDVAVLDAVGLDVAVLGAVGFAVEVLGVVGFAVEVLGVVGLDVAVLDVVGLDVAVPGAVGLDSVEPAFVNRKNCLCSARVGFNVNAGRSGSVGRGGGVHQVSSNA